jgi:phospholipase C
MFIIAATSGGESRIPANGYTDVNTIFDRLEERGISWKFYVEGYNRALTFRVIESGKAVPSQLIKTPLLNIPRFVDDPQLSKRIVDLNEYYDDLERGSLPAVSYIIPKGGSGPSITSLIVAQRNLKIATQELMRSSAWSTSALLWTHDEADGWYDHVVPPKSEFGARVPTILISPYAARGKIDSTQLEHSSVLKFIEYNWDVSSLTERDAGANNLIGAFDFHQSPRPPQFITMTRPVESVQKKPQPNLLWVYVLYGGVLVCALIGAGLLYALTKKSKLHAVSDAIARLH